MQLRSGKLLGAETNAVNTCSYSECLDRNISKEKFTSTIEPVGSWEWFNDSVKKYLDIANNLTNPVITEELIEKYQIITDLYRMINTHIENMLFEKQFSVSIINLFSVMKTKAYVLKGDCDLKISNFNTMIKNGDKEYIKVKICMINLKIVVESCYINMCHLSDKYKLCQKLVEIIRSPNRQCDLNI